MTSPSFAKALEACTERCRKMDAPLAERLSAFQDDVKRLAPDFTDIVDRMVGRLKAAGAGETAPAVGEQMPPFVLPDEQGHLVSLGQLIEQGPVVISFFRGHWCHYCRISADALAEIDADIRKAGGQIVVITPEVQEFNNELKTESRAPFHILTDLDCGYSLQINVAIQINDEKRQAMTAAGWDIALFNDNESWTLPIPATFVVGTDGVVKARFVDPDYRKRAAIEDILAALR